MSCQWRRTSHDLWEISQSNPPSELPNDPIISTSSNPDERSSSPTHQMADSMFSNAAQAETEPIPRDFLLSDHEDMLILDSPSRHSATSEIDSHIAPNRTDREDTTQPFNADFENGGTTPNLDDAEFVISESSGQDSDSSYVAETAQRRGRKKVPSKKPRGKAVGRPRTKDNTQRAPVTTKEPKPASTTKGRLQKLESASKAAPKRAERATGVTGARKPRTNSIAKPALIPTRASRRTQEDNKDHTAEKLDKPAVYLQLQSNEKDGSRKPLTPRLPKKSFYREPEGNPLAQIEQKVASKAKSRSGFSTKKDGKQGSSSRKQIHPTSPTETDDDVSYQRESRVEEKQKPHPEAQSKSHAPCAAPEAAIGPNSKKKRSLVESRSKARSAETAIKPNHRQRLVRNSADDEYYGGSGDGNARCSKRLVSAKPKQLKDPEPGSFRDGADLVSNEADVPTQTEDTENGIVGQKLIGPGAVVEPMLKATTTGHDPLQNIELSRPMQPPRGIAQRDSEIQLPASAAETMIVKRNFLGPPIAHEDPEYSRQSNKNILADPVEEILVVSYSGGRQTSTDQQHTLGEAKDLREVEKRGTAGPIERTHALLLGQNVDADRQEIQVRNTQKDFQNDDAYVDQPQNIPTSTKCYYPLAKKVESRQQFDAPSAERSGYPTVSKLGSPLRHSRTAVGKGATSEHNSLHKLQEPANHGAQREYPAEFQASFDHKLPRSLQVAPNCEPQLPGENNPAQSNCLRAQSACQTSKKMKTAKGPQDYRPETDHTSRIILRSSSPSDDYLLARNIEHVMPQGPRLHPKSVEFSSRVAQGQRQTDHYRHAGQETSEGMRSHHAGKRLSWLQPSAVIKPRNDSNPMHSKATKQGGAFAEQCSMGRDGQPHNPPSKSTNEARWQDAVEVASGGVVDTLHLISTKLLDHLRTREESVFAIIHEYKRNGTKVSERLAKHQTGERINASATAEHKCSEVAKLYKELSKETEAFRANCLLKRRNQSYVEWQQRISRIKSSIHRIRGQAALG